MLMELLEKSVFKIQFRCTCIVLRRKLCKLAFYCRYETTKKEEKVAIDETLFLYLLTTIMLRKFHMYEL